MNSYVIAGYLIAIVSIVGYSLSLILRRNSLRKQLQKLKNDGEQNTND